jgi:hypothetical protein
MIIFLTLAYCAFLFILVKIGIIKLNTFWKASPLIWMTLLLIFLFIPMNWGAPAGPVMLYQNVVSITPNVSGEVIEVPAIGREPMKKGDVLFRIDPTIYQATVDQLEATLELSRTRLDQSERLFARGAGSEYDVQRYRTEVLGYEAQLASAHWNLDSCTVVAPGDGYPIAVTLEPGNRVSPLQAAMAYVVTSRNLVGLALMTPQGQLAPSGQVPVAPTGQDPPAPFGVVVVPSEETLDHIDEFGKLPGGATGTAAIYTESAQFSQVIRKVIIRLEMWMNYVNPL